MRLLFTVIMLCLSFCVAAQKEASNWLFGQKVGLRFLDSGPMVQFGELDTLEGCASISDNDGNLLFYSDGSNVWSRDHKLMPNGTGLLGDESSTQSAIIVPKPKDPNIYYLFTVGSTVIPSGFNYYTVDMTLNGGYGDIVGGAVNLTDGHGGNEWSEKITAVQGSVCNTYWVISLVSDLFYAYKIDDNGVRTDAVISQIDFLSSSSRGYLKVSPNGKKLAAGHQGGDPRYHGLYLYSFNNTTGEVSNDEINLFPNEAIETYGIEFSPQTTKLYASTLEGDIYTLYQFDLTSSNIPRSAKIIHQESPAFRGALQLGPDYKIYATIPVEYTIGTSYLDVIHYPELEGRDCGFEEDYLYLGNGNYSMQGLPPFIQSFFYSAEINIVNPFEAVTFISKELSICRDDSYTLEGSEISGAEYFWTFDNGLRVIDIPTPTPPHLLTINSTGSNTPGLYKLIIDTNDECDTQLVGEANLTFTEPPIFNATATLSQCDLFDNNSSDGLTPFNLYNSVDDITLNNPDDFDVFFYLNDIDADNDIHNQNSLPQIYSNISQNQILTVKVYGKDSNCYRLGSLRLNVTPSNLLTTSDIYGCDNESDTVAFDLNTKLDQIISENNLSADTKILFYDTIEDAIENSNAINGIFDSQTDNSIYFRVNDNNQCPASGNFDLKINALPPINSQEETIEVCHFDFPITINSTIPANLVQDYDYEWNTGETSHEVIINNDLELTVTVKDKRTQCKESKKYNIVKISLPEITDVNINLNSRTVTVLTTNDNDNLFALDDPSGVYQEDNVFKNVHAGIHDLYVKNQCGITQRKIYLLGFPPYFTPNDDNNNDGWEIKGLNIAEFSVTRIQVFDRYGKLLKTLAPGAKWNGIFNGERLPASDYWFVVDLEDQDRNVNTYQGHFSLVR